MSAARMSKIEKSHAIRAVMRELGPECTREEVTSELGWPISSAAFFTNRKRLFADGEAKPPANAPKQDEEPPPASTAEAPQTEVDRIGEAYATLGQAVGLFRGFEATRRALASLETSWEMMRP